MRRAILSALVVLMAGSLAACDGAINIVDTGDGIDGSGTSLTQERQVSDFDRVVLSGEGAVTIVKGPSGLTIETDDNLLQHIETGVKGGVLEIKTERGIDLDPTDGVRYRVSTPDLSGVTLSGAGSFEIASWQAADFTITLAGAGDVDMTSLAAQSLSITISGVGQVNVRGAVDTLLVTISGAGNLEARELQSAAAIVTTSGAGSATVWATDTLEATVSGVGSIDYFGTPLVTGSVTGVGTINSRDGR